MGYLRFQVFPAGRLQNWPEVQRAYVCGFDQSVHPTRVEIDGNLLTCKRQNAESGKLHVSWPVLGFGRPIVSTASLPEREAPYLLPLELARGKIVQLRNQLATWEQAGMQIPVGFAALNAGAHKFFAQAVASQTDPEQSGQLSDYALQQAFKAAELLTISYTQQSLALRHRRYQQIPTLLGCFLPPEQQGTWQAGFVETFNAGAVPIQWSQVEPEEGDYHWEKFDDQVDWCLDHKLLVQAGPLLDFAVKGLPEWVLRWEKDIWNLQSFVCDFVETVMRRYQGRVRHWEIAARGNSGGGLALSEEHRLGLVAKALEVARHVDEEAQLYIRVDQPWGEYQARGQHKLAPLQFADALVRTGLGLSGINLEISVGYSPRGSMSRDLLDFSRLIDTWSMLGLPLQISLTCPSGDAPDPLCTTDLEVERPTWKTPWSEPTQAEWIDLYLPLLIAKPAVIGVYWNQLTDGLQHQFPHGGLMRKNGSWKPVLQHMARMRKAFLK